MAELTERQKEIQELLDQGKSAKEIASALGITPNGVYQQLRRMRDGGASTGRVTTRRRGRQSTGTSSETASNGQQQEQRQAPTKVLTPLQALRVRRDEIEAEVKEAAADMAAAQKALDRASETHTKLTERHSEELQRISFAEAALRGETVEMSANGKADAEEAPEEPQEAQPDAKEEQAPEEPKADEPKAEEAPKRSRGKAADKPEEAKSDDKQEAEPTPAAA